MDLALYSFYREAGSGNEKNNNLVDQYITEPSGQCFQSSTEVSAWSTVYAGRYG